VVLLLELMLPTPVPQPTLQYPIARVGAPRLDFLGTGGGAHPLRCHASIAFQPAPGRVLLLDTGGGFEVVAQLRRAGIDLGAVTRIFLSHRHSDHIAGLEPLLLHIGLQAMRSGRAAADVYVYGQAAVLEAARTILQVVASTAPQFIADAGGRLHWQPLTPDAPIEVWPDVTITAFLADHVPDDGTNLGCALDHRTAGGTRRIVYSGDTRPTEALRQAAQKADVLIHEVGGLDARQALVSRAGHSTAGEAARQAAVAGVGRLFLFHIPDDTLVPALLEEARHTFAGPVVIPDDGDGLSLE
jgi:ribonuclease BN (tRNA processing enzyme)